MYLFSFPLLLLLSFSIGREKWKELASLSSNEYAEEVEIFKVINFYSILYIYLNIR